VQLTESDNGASVKLRNGGELVISLESNLDGFAWVIAEPAPASARIQGDPEYLPPCRATRRWRGRHRSSPSKATAEGTAELTLEYRRRSTRRPRREDVPSSPSRSVAPIGSSL
jgi:predicted secreted protein